MKFICAKNDLSEALQIVSKAIANKPQTPIMSGVYIKADHSTLELQANNLEIAISTKIAVNTESAGEIVVIGKYLLEIIRKLSGEVVTFEHDEEHHVVNIKSGSANFNLLSMSPEDFPTMKFPETYSTFYLKPNMFRELIRKTVYSCAVEDVRPMFTGCCLEIKGNDITMSATNTHRIAVAFDNIDEPLEPASFIIPSKTLNEILKLLDSAQSNVKIDCSSKIISFTIDNVYIISRLIDGEFPPYEKVVPKSSDTIATINVKALSETVDRVALISKETQYNTIRFIFRQDGITISSDSPEVGTAEEHVAARVEGPDIDISFNVKYIVDVLKVTDSDECIIKLTKPLSPIDYREKDNDNFIYIVTPVRT